MKKWMLFLFLMLFMQNMIFCDLINNDVLNKRYIKIVKDLDKDAKAGSQYLVVIALNKYQNRLPFNYCIDNAKLLRNILYEKYYINNIFELYDDNAKFSDIKKVFSDLNSKLKPEDSIIIYYCGAGFYDAEGKKGYWLPYDAGINETSKNNWLPNEEVEKDLIKLNAKHILLISDACFFSADMKETKNTKGKKEKVIDYYKKINSNKSIQILSSGIEDTDQTKSQFFTNIYNKLKNNYNIYLDAAEIYENIKTWTKPAPVFGQILNKNPEETGSFLFFYRSLDFTFYKEAKVNENKTEIVKVSSENLIRTIGIISCPVGATTLTIGLVLLIGDLAGFSSLLRDKIDHPTTYYDYENTYNTFIGLFVSGVILTAVGTALFAVSFPMIYYKYDFKLKKKMAFNISVNNGLNLYFNYLF